MMNMSQKNGAGLRAPKAFKTALMLSFAAASSLAAETIELDSTYRAKSADEGNSFVFNDVSVESSDTHLYGFYMLGTTVKNTTVESVGGALSLKTIGSGTSATKNIYGVYIRTGYNAIKTLSGSYNFLCDTTSTSSSGGSVYGVAVTQGSLYNVSDLTLNVSTNSKNGDAYGFNFSNGAYGVTSGDDSVGVKFSNIDASVSGNGTVSGISGAERVASFQGALRVYGVEGENVNALKFDNTSGVVQKTFKLLGDSTISAVNGNSIRSAVKGALNIVGDAGATQLLDGNMYIAAYANTLSSMTFTQGNFALQNSTSKLISLSGVRDIANSKETLYAFDGGSVTFNDAAEFSSTLVELKGGVSLSAGGGKSIALENSALVVSASQLRADKLAIGAGSTLNASDSAYIDLGVLSVFEGSGVSLDESSTLNIGGLEVVFSELESGATYDLADIFGDDTTIVLSAVGENITMSDVQGHSFDVVVSENGLITAVPEPSLCAAILGLLALAFAVHRRRA